MLRASEVAAELARVMHLSPHAANTITPSALDVGMISKKVFKCVINQSASNENV